MQDREDPPFELDENGLLPESGRLDEELLRLRDLPSAGMALVLLGEPGTGKTTAFGQLTGADAATVSPKPGQSGTVWVLGSELTDLASFRELIGDHLEALPRADSTGPFPTALTIVLDQLDESPMLARLSRRFQSALAAVDTRSLRLLIACRSADYPTGLTGVLEQALDRCVVADLAPLTRADVTTLATQVGVDGERFIRAVVDAGVGVLANVPLTLRILVDAYRGSRTGEVAYSTVTSSRRL
ncbi:NACHT domain-containing protein [Saccharothrix hoggarensis]|uniref:AAA ATPase-like protein n=1 Tax=Saccharothrix hoggarensis TaxID=913853 RepID=A0ABW3QIC4_9PSEU